MLRIIGDGEHAKVVREAARWWQRGKIIAIGNIDDRAEAWADDDEGLSFWANVIHRDASVSRDAYLWGGVYVGPGAVINRGAYVGFHAIVNSGAIVEHDVVIGTLVNVGPGVVIGGGAKIGRETYLGIGCMIRDHVKIGRDVTVGMGAVVVSDVPDGVTVMGCPARIVECST